MAGSAAGRAYLFEFVPPVGKGRDRVGVRMARFGSDSDALAHADDLLKTHPTKAVKVFKVGPDGESFPVATVPEPQADASPQE